MSFNTACATVSFYYHGSDFHQVGFHCKTITSRQLKEAEQETLRINITVICFVLSDSSNIEFTKWYSSEYLPCSTVFIARTKSPKWKQWWISISVKVSTWIDLSTVSWNFYAFDLPRWCILKHFWVLCFRRLIPAGRQSSWNSLTHNFTRWKINATVSLVLRRPLQNAWTLYNEGTKNPWPF